MSLSRRSERRRAVTSRVIAASVPGVAFRYVLNPDGTVRHHYVSPGARALLGSERDPRRTVLDAIAPRLRPEHREAALAAQAHSLATGEPFKVTGAYAHPDGRERWLMAEAVRGTSGRGLPIWTGYIVDVTTERDLQQRLAREAESRNLMLASASHELRAPTHTLSLALQSLTEGHLPANQRESLRIFTRRLEVGAASYLELTQVQTLLVQAELLVAQMQQQRDARRLSLNTLLGDLSDGSTVATEANTPLDDTMIAPVAPGLPSDLLTRRPDVLAAEHRLQGANANIGAARAAFFPQISLTAFGGTASTELERLFRGANRVWGFSPSLSLPIFDAGRKRANLALAEVRKNLAVVQYEQTVQNAFREVADALSAQHWALRQVEVHQRALAIERERARLSRLSYDHGASSFLEVLDAERNLISAEQQLVQTRRALLSSRVALYAALGGGSHDVDETPPGPTSASPANFTRR